MKNITVIIILLAIEGLSIQICQAQNNNNDQRPNILFVLSDNQSYPHTSAYGDKTVNTPGFDRIATEGILFHNAFAPNPACAPTRSTILTGRYLWENEEAGGHQTLFPAKYVPFNDVLEASGYHIGFTGKGCQPFNWKQGLRDREPAGPEFNNIRYSKSEFSSIIENVAEIDVEAVPKNEIVTDPEAFSTAISTIDYAANFKEFLSNKSDDQPFFFWFGSREPHLPFEEGAGLKSGKKLEDVNVPGFLPDNEIVRSTMLDYALQIEWFDRHLVEMIEILKESGELDNTIIIVTSDNGMQFPRSIHNCYEYGLHVPMAISWPAKIKKERVSEDLISLADIAPTILELANSGTGEMQPISTKSFADILLSDRSGIIDSSRDAIYAGRERHGCARWMNLGYPQRVIRTSEYLYIRNFYPERWPAGAPQRLQTEYPFGLDFMHGLDENGKFTGRAYHDIDNSPVKTYLIENVNNPEVSWYYELSMGKRPAEELYNIKDDPSNLYNLAEDSNYSQKMEELRNKLYDFLKETNDPRMVGPNPEIFENYQRFYTMRSFPKPDWVK